MILVAAKKLGPVLLSLSGRATTSSAFFFFRATPRTSSALVRSLHKGTHNGIRDRSWRPTTMSSMSASSASAGATTGVAEAETQKFVVAACQMLCGSDKAANIVNAEQAVRDASAAGAQVCRQEGRQERVFFGAMVSCKSRPCGRTSLELAA